MIKNLVNWLKNLRQSDENKVEALAIVRTRPRPQPAPISNVNHVYLNDPTTPQFIVEQTTPTNTYLPMRGVGESGGGYPLGSIQQQAMALKQMVNDALVYMAEKSPKPVKKWAAVQTLTLMPRAGKDINAYYDRGALRFFFFGDPTIRKNIYACDSRSVVVHEFGHAFLDILRPDFWSAQASEVWAFHEAFGDMTALLSILQHPTLIEEAIKETGGDLLKSNIISRMAAQMGVGLFHLTEGKDGELPDCIRDLTKKFVYTEPERLPKKGRDDVLINEPHSFSRVFSGAFYELVVRISREQKDVDPIKAVTEARDIMANYLLKAVSTVPLTVRLFDAVCRQMLQADQANGGKYQTILLDVFNARQLLRSKFMMLEDVDLTTMAQGMTDPHEIQDNGSGKVLRTLTTKKIKLSEKMGLMALDNNPLIDLEIEVPNQKAYYFNEEEKLVEIVQDHDDEVIDAAYTCLNILNTDDLVGDHETALFENRHGKLVRKQIVCTCGRPNYCDPNAPEYGKAWKPANNAGCTKCSRGNCKPQSCDCNPPEKAPAPKTGCYTSVRAGGLKSYRFGSMASRKVC